MKTKFGYFDKDFNIVATIEVDINKIESFDPLAFAYGVSSGVIWRDKDIRGKKIHGDSRFTDLAPEYLRGFLLGYKGFLVPEGTKFRKGNELSFALLDKQIDPNTLNK